MDERAYTMVTFKTPSGQYIHAFVVSDWAERYDVLNEVRDVQFHEAQMRPEPDGTRYDVWQKPKAIGEDIIEGHDAVDTTFKDAVDTTFKDVVQRTQVPKAYWDTDENG
jgi:hypothetical protein